MTEPKTKTVRLYNLIVTTPEGKTLDFKLADTKGEIKRRFAGQGGKGKRAVKVPGYISRLVPVGTREEISYAHLRQPRLTARPGAKFSVNVYEREQGYGGPEEGGWWYHTQGLVKNYQFRKLSKARAFLASLKARYSAHLIGEDDTCLVSKRETVNEWNSGFSVLDGYGQGRVVELENHPLPALESLSRPRYE
jgi:hypothetical protein